MDIGIVGLGRMGMGMARRLHKAGHRVVAFNRSVGKVRLAEEAGMDGANTLDDFVKNLPRPRVVMVMVPAGEATEEMMAELLSRLEKGDVVIDGGNSYWRDSVRRGKRFAERGIFYLDQGTSGGLVGAEQGYCLMVGGEKLAFELAEPALRDLAMSDGCALVGPMGAGHFAKMVHNGIEYGMMEAMAEGMDLLKNGPYSEYNLAEITALWQRGSIVSSFLLDVLQRQLAEHPNLEQASSEVSDTGEGKWAIAEALEAGVPFSVISEALFARFRSRGLGSFGNKVVSAMRLGFGGHTK